MLNFTQPLTRMLWFFWTALLRMVALKKFLMELSVLQGIVPHGIKTMFSSKGRKGLAPPADQQS